MYVLCCLGGPFHIASAMSQFCPRSEQRQKQFWMVNEVLRKRWCFCGAVKSTFKVTCTPDANEASNFYLKQEISNKQSYFYLATDTNDPRHKPPNTSYPQYFLHVKGKKPKGLSFVVKRFAQFRLFDREDLTPVSLPQSKWVPDRVLGSQPYLILPQLKLREKIKSRTSKKPLTLQFSRRRGRFSIRKMKLKQSSDRVAAQLFVLEPGHKTYVN